MLRVTKRKHVLTAKFETVADLMSVLGLIGHHQFYTGTVDTSSKLQLCWLVKLPAPPQSPSHLLWGCVLYIL